VSGGSEQSVSGGSEQSVSGGSEQSVSGGSEQSVSSGPLCMSRLPLSPCHCKDFVWMQPYL